MWAGKRRFVRLVLAGAAYDARKPDSTFAVIGDVPYGTAAEEHFPTFVRGINADRTSRW